MFHCLDHRAGHHALLLVVWAVLCLPNLGGPSLWDIDEGNNAECSVEMWRSGNWVVPTFNYELREDKPALLYWCQMGCYAVLGVNETSARLPSALAALLTILVTYELGRQTFGKRAGLLAGLILASSTLFCAAGHFANPDALLCACTTVHLALFWNDYRSGGKGWLELTGVACGLAVLAKGPVGIVLPLGVVGLFLLWRGDVKRLLDIRLVGAGLLFVLVAAPWYIWVGLETKGEWLLRFWNNHHAKRMTTALESHGGPIFYYVIVLVLGLAPWSIFLAASAWNALRGLRAREEGTPADTRPAVQYLLCWCAVYFIFFSLVRTKLPNYILPLYPPGAILIGWFLVRWRNGEVHVPAWLERLELLTLALIGVGLSVGLVIASGLVPLGVLRGRQVPGLEGWAWMGALPIGAALVSWWCLRRGWRDGMIGAIAGSAVLFTAVLGARAIDSVDRYKSPRALVAALPADHPRREVRMGACAYFHPSLVFYCQREVKRFENEQEVSDFLAGPLPAYLFIQARVWEMIAPRIRGRVLARHADLYDGQDVVVVTNEEAD